jgi:predicted transcriptional regulator
MFTEVLPVKLPEGTRAKLAEIAKSRYESSCAVARKAIMELVQQEERRKKLEAAA